MSWGRMALTETGVAHLHELCAFLQCGDILRTAISHRCAKTADHLIDRCAEFTFERNASFDPFGDKFLNIILHILE